MAFFLVNCCDRTNHILRRDAINLALLSMVENVYWPDVVTTDVVREN